MDERPPSRRSSSFMQELIAAALGALGLFTVAGIDHFSGPDIHIGLFYLVPVGLAAWYAGRWPGYFLSLLAIPLWMQFSEPRSDFKAGLVVLLFNLSVRLVYYPAVVEVLILLRNTERRLAKQVDARTAELRAEIVERERAQASLRVLAAKLSDAEDAERRRIAYDIHDAFSQMLSVMKLNLETAVAESPTDSRQYHRLVDVIKVIGDLIHQTRELTFNLHPAMLDDLGLVPTLKGFSEEFHRRTQAQVMVTETGEPRKIPTPLASYLFRSIKELINNAVKHGNAKEIITTVHWLNSGVRIVVDDDGGGFDPAAAMAPGARRGLGLAGIDERLTSLGGTLRIESQPGQGARVILETALPPQP